MDETTPIDFLARFEALEAEVARLKAQARGVPSAGEGIDACASDVLGGSLAVPEGPASRRDLLRYGAVALGAAAAGLAPRPAEAADGGPVLIGTIANSGTSTTGLQAGAANATAFFAFSSATTGVGRGVYGQTNASGGIGVLGLAAGSGGTTVGVWGESFSADGTGVVGFSQVGGTPVRGEIPGFSSDNGIAIYGLNNSSYAGPGPGAGGFGVYGLSAKGHGLVGATSAAGGAAVVGATNGVAGAYAGAFYGPVVVSGAFTVVGGPKSAAVPHPDGSHRLVYCIESPESWFEDFGDGQLVDGRADVAIDPVFAAVVDLAAYHVFLTEYDGHNALYVSERTADGFRVDAKTGTGCGAFSWRLVAKRTDIVGERLAKVTIPSEPPLPSVPPLPEPTPDPRAARPRPGRP